MLYTIAFTIIARPIILWAADRLSPKSNSWAARGLTAAALVALQYTVNSGVLSDAYTKITDTLDAINATNAPA